MERTLSWHVHSRRLARDYECLTSTDEALVDATMSQLMTRRLARGPSTPFQPVLIGSLLAAEIEVERVSLADGVEEGA